MRMSSIFQFSNVTFLYEMFRTAFGGIEWFLIAYFVCLAGFFVIGKERLSLGFLYPFLFMLLTIFNPFFIVPLAAKDRPDHPDPPPVLAASGQSRARLCLYHALYSPHKKMGTASFVYRLRCLCRDRRLFCPALSAHAAEYLQDKQ